MVIMTETIHYTSPIGIIQITCSKEMLHTLEFTGKQDTALPVVSKTPQHGITRQCLQQLDDYFAGKNFQFSLPLHQDGTAFQQKVWEALITIQPGATASYLDMSRKLGNEKLIRALGAANGKNKIAILVPCHRVIGNNGKLVGYAGGLWRKSWLLQHEAKYCNGVRTLF